MGGGGGGELKGDKREGAGINFGTDLIINKVAKIKILDKLF